MLCSAAAVDIPLPGTATGVSCWLCVEQPGAWGRDVLGDAVLGPQVTAELAVRTTAAQVRPTLIRRPGRQEFTGVRTVLLVSSRPTGSWCERLEITDPRQLLDIDLTALSGPPPDIGVPVADSPVLVCAHGKRDQCCALFGRPIAAALAADFPGRVWECSHTGGHRFAPALVLLPSGLTYGRVDTAAAVEAVRAADRGAVSLHGLRGRSCYRPLEQVAEIAVRERVTAGADDLVVLSNAESDSPAADFENAAVVAHRDGRRWLVTARTVDHAPRQASCGAGPKPATSLVAAAVRELAIQ
ncbi:sucrase ferredoxin [Nocardia panacis]|uniref:Sucrase ferredoxin n=2 Tax=Nocardia panacis TaxID=2340916 RepID=A0A3A4KEQ3_9NOCA|nr:sucrase ferredoxin [Nocardia panacis]